MKFNFEFAEKISRTYSDECRPLCHELKLPQTAFDILMFLANNPEYKTARDIVEIRKIKANLVSVNVGIWRENLWKMIGGRRSLSVQKRLGLSLKEEGVYSSSLQQICLQG